VVEATAEPTPAVEFKTGVVHIGIAVDANGGNINLRQLPSTSSYIPWAVASGTELKVKALTDVQPDGFAWYQVEYEGEIVYIRSDLIIIKE